MYIQCIYIYIQRHMQTHNLYIIWLQLNKTYLHIHASVKKSRYPKTTPVFIHSSPTSCCCCSRSCAKRSQMRWTESLSAAWLSQLIWNLSFQCHRFSQKISWPAKKGWEKLPSPKFKGRPYYPGGVGCGGILVPFFHFVMEVDKRPCCKRERSS